MKIRYREMALNRPVVVRRGWPAEIEVNTTNAYIGEWVVFKLPLSETATAEVRMPMEEALEQGLIIAADQLEFDHSDYEEYTEEEA